MVTHKLTKKHIEFKQNKMNVRLAVETFSESVGDSLTILREQKHPKFIGSQPTSNHVYIMNKLFDIFNSRGSRNQNLYKRALSSENKDEVFAFLDKCKQHLMSLKIRRKKKKVPVYKTINFTPILGFVMGLTNLKLMYAELVESGSMSKLSTYTFSQDHLEMLFAKIRARNGSNNNPTPMQFRGAYRRLLCNLDIKSPESANCIMLDSDTVL